MGIAERKEREFKRREKEILQAALRLFDGDDWQLVSIERIAQEAEIGKGTIYLHFASKEAIYARLALDFGRQVLVKLCRIELALPVLARLQQAIRIFFDAHRGARRYQRVVDYCDREDFRRRLDETTQAELQQVDEQIMALIHGILSAGINAGTFPDRPLPLLVAQAHATLVGAVRILGSECLGDIEPDAFIDEITRFLLAGLMYQQRVQLAPEPVGALPTAARS